MNYHLLGDIKSNKDCPKCVKIEVYGFNDEIFKEELLYNIEYHMYYDIYHRIIICGKVPIKDYKDRYVPLQTVKFTINQEGALEREVKDLRKTK